MLAFDATAPGERHGGGWWTALCTLASQPAPDELPIKLALTDVAGSSASLSLGTLRVSPGPAIAQTGGRGAENDLVAICLAAHEPPPDLFRRQIESIRSQSHEQWLCLISDDGSSPRRRRELLEIVGDDERFVVSEPQPRVGFYRNFERALRMAPPEAALIALADQDDEWHPDKLATLIAGLRDGDRLIHSDARVVDRGGELISPTLWPRGRPSESGLGDALFANPVTGASSLFRRGLLEFVLPFPALPGRAFHDRWIALVAFALGGVRRVDRPLYDYLQHDQALLGHGALAGAVGDNRLAAARRRIGRIATGRVRPKWRAAHDEVLLRTVAEATVLRIRLGEALDASDSAQLAAIESLPDSPVRQLALLVRNARRSLPGAPGIEPALVRGVAWRRLAGVRQGLEPARDGLNSGLARISRARRASPTGAARSFGITVTSADPRMGYGDLQVAQALGAELRALGNEVRLLELDGDHWRRQLGSLDIVVSLLDRFPCDRLPEGVETVAWVRNWTDRWLERPWFPRYDLILASSTASADLIAERGGPAPPVMPLATDPSRFYPRPPDPELACDLLFVGSYWGAERQVAEVLPQLAERFRVRVYGGGWEAVPAMAALSEGLLPFERLAAAYCSAALVVDDVATHAAPYAAVNARVFDALACGAVVASNDPVGPRALFGEDFPVWSDTASLGDLAASAVDSGGDRAGASATLRARVLERHTYAQRARQLLAALEEARIR